MRSFLVSFIIHLTTSPLKLIDTFIPKNNNIWIFGSGSGNNYNDNSKYLYEYVVSKGNRIRPVWLSLNKDIVKKLNKKGKESYYFYSLRGIYMSIIAGVAVMSTSWIDLPFTTYLFPKKIKLIQLWHGTPLKKLIGLHTGSKSKVLLRSILLKHLGREYDLVISATEKNVSIFSESECFNISKRNIKVLGQPRNDILFDNTAEDTLSDKKVVLYLPTWRNYEYNLFSKELGFEIDNVNKYLKEANCVLIIKHHQKDQQKYMRFSNKSNVIFRSDIDDIYPYLRNVDVLLTDYSSIYFDFLLLNKPIIFLPFDFEEYKKENYGFYYEYDKVTPGPKARNWKDVLNHLDDMLNRKDDYNDKRKRIKKIFNKYHDGGSSKRIYEEIVQNVI